LRTESNAAKEKTRGIKHRDRVPADHRPDSSPKPVGVRLPRHGAAPTPAASALYLAHCTWRVVCVPDERTDNKQVVEQKLLSLTSFPILLLIFFSFLLKIISLSVTLCTLERRRSCHRDTWQRHDPEQCCSDPSTRERDPDRHHCHTSRVLHQ
jgi:hypothetical protein